MAGGECCAEPFSPTVPQHEQAETINNNTNMTMNRTFSRRANGPGQYCCQEPCSTCAKLPLKYRRGHLSSMSIRDGRELLQYFDAGYFELMLQEDRRKKEEPQVDSQAATIASDKAQKHLRRLQRDLADMGLIRKPDQRFTGESDQARLMAPFCKEEIVFGHKIGTGGFSAVYEIEAFRIDKNIRGQGGESNQYDLEEAAREYLQKHVRRKPPQQYESSRIGATKQQRHRKQVPQTSLASYAVKHLKNSLASDPDKYQKAAVDLALEGQLLLVLDHPHIISLRGWARDGTKAFAGGSPSDYFLILDRLPEILDERIFIWRESLLKYKCRQKVPWLRNKFSVKIKQLFIDRIHVAHDVASAIEYMHDRRIINRDLKASNIGFDLNGEVKIFDLGLSRLLPHEKYKTDDGYVMSRVGTKATMAPEVRRKQPYDTSADVYSFGIVLWEILMLSTSTDYLRSLKKEVRKRLEGDDDEETSDEDYLPLPVCLCWPKAMQALVRQCLMYDPRERPTMCHARRVLCNQMEGLGVRMLGGRGGQTARRSTFRVDLSKFDMDEFSRTSIDTSLREPLSSTDFRLLPTSSSNQSNRQNNAGSRRKLCTSPEDNGTVATAQSGDAKLDDTPVPISILPPDCMTDTLSDSPKLSTG
ncbi:hypothetical protein MPSEU_000663000 [Mayamaea pseudoterrestris]|nr:hypothetical protein MPSEU_000663000 [Mayamaea pseudoterrestris]